MTAQAGQVVALHRALNWMGWVRVAIRGLTDDAPGPARLFSVKGSRIVERGRCRGSARLYIASASDILMAEVIDAPIHLAVQSYGTAWRIAAPVPVLNSCRFD